MMDYVAHILVMIGIYAILSISLDLSVAHAGVVSLAHASFAALGAYSTTLLDRYGLSTYAGFFLGLILTYGAGWMLGRLTAVLDRDVIAVVTYAFASLVTTLIRNAPFTGGSRGLTGITHLTVLGFRLDTPIKFAPVAGVSILAIALLYRLLDRSPFARALRGARDDEVLARSLGYDTAYLRAQAVSISAAGAALAGFLIARYIQFLHPDTFPTAESILVLTMIIMGGLGRLGGAVGGAVLLIVIPEALRFVGIPSIYAANARQIIYGLTLVIFVLLRPQGISRSTSYS